LVVLVLDVIRGLADSRLGTAGWSESAP
jgi:hypothetical protein